MKTSDIEIAVADFFNPRQNIIVPNISWGLSVHECDLFILTKAGVAHEIEIKVSKSDLKRDKLKYHHHLNNKVGRLWFAIPESLLTAIEHIPEHAGIITVSEFERCKKERLPKITSAYKFTEEEGNGYEAGVYQNLDIAEENAETR